MTDFAEYALGSGPGVVQLDLLEISHPDFAQTYRLVRNSEAMRLTGDKRGVIVTHEGGAGPFEYQYCPMSVRTLESPDDLSQAVQIQLGDVGDIIATEIARVWEANGMGVRPTLTYRTYRSDDLSAPMDDAIVLEIAEVVTTIEGAAFQAEAPKVNESSTGEYYHPEAFPMLRGFL